MKLFFTRRNLISDNRDESQSVSPISEERLFIMLSVFNKNMSVSPVCVIFLGNFLFVSFAVPCAYMIFTLII